MKTRLHKVIQILKDAGGILTERAGNLQVWTLRKGRVIVQLHLDGGVSTYADWPLGDSYELLEIALQ
jgi:hypothetical protein